MAFTPIPAADIEVGKPTKKSIFKKTKDNFDDHESRITNLSTGANKVIVFVGEIANLKQYVNGSGELTRIMLEKASQDYSIVNVQIYVLHGGPDGDVAPTAGTLEIDIKQGTDLTSMNTIFSAKPSVTTFGNGDTNASVSFIVDGEKISQGDWIQLDITNLQTGQTRIFIDVYGEVQ